MIHLESKSAIVTAVLFFVLAFWGIQYALRGYWEPDEARFVYVAREMISSHSLFVPMRNGVIYTQKPPLMMWLISIGEFLFGTPFGSRLPVLLGAFLSLLSIFSIGKRLADKNIAILTVLLLSTSADFWFDMGIGQIDPLLTGFVLSSVALFPFDGNSPFKTKQILLPSISAGLAVLAKGPVGLALPILIITALVYPVRREVKCAIKPKHIVVGLAIALAVPCLWLVSAALNGAPAEYFHEIIFSQTASRIASGYGHRKPFYYFSHVFLTGFLPWTFLLPPAVAILWSKNRKMLLQCGMWALSVLILFSVATSKRSVYILTAYPAAALIIAAAAGELRNSRVMTVFSRSIAIVVPLSLLLTGVFFSCFATSDIMPSSIDFSQVGKQLSIALFAAGICSGICVLAKWRKLPFVGIWFPIALFGIVFWIIGNFLLPILNPLKEPLAIEALAEKYTAKGDSLLLLDMNGETLSLHAKRRGWSTEKVEDFLSEMIVRKTGLAIIIEDRKDDLKEAFQLLVKESGIIPMGKKRYMWLAFDARGVDRTVLEEIFHEHTSGTDEGVPPE